MKDIYLVLFLILMPATSFAQTESNHLKNGPVRRQVEQNCMICHSLDYIQTHSFLNRKGWETEVNKMKNAFGAPLHPEDVSPIVDYLVKYYGS